MLSLYHWLNRIGMEIAISAAPHKIMTGIDTMLERSFVADPVMSNAGISKIMDTAHTPITVIGDTTFFLSII